MIFDFETDDILRVINVLSLSVDGIKDRNYADTEVIAYNKVKRLADKLVQASGAL